MAIFDCFLYVYQRVPLHQKRPDDAVLCWIHHLPLPRMGVRIPRRVQILQTDLAKLGPGTVFVDGPATATGAQKGHLVYDYTKSMRLIVFRHLGVINNVQPQA